MNSSTTTEGSLTPLSIHPSMPPNSRTQQNQESFGLLPRMQQLFHKVCTWCLKEGNSLFTSLPISSSILVGLSSTACLSLLARLPLLKKCAYLIWKSRGSVCIAISHTTSLLLWKKTKLYWPGFITIASDGLIVLEAGRNSGSRSDLLIFAFGCARIVPHDAPSFIEAKRNINTLAHKILSQPIKSGRRIFAGAALCATFFRKAPYFWLLAPTLIDAFLDQTLLIKYIQNYVALTIYRTLFALTELCAITCNTFKYIARTLILPLLKEFKSLIFSFCIRPLLILSKTLKDKIRGAADIIYNYIITPAKNLSTQIARAAASNTRKFILSPLISLGAASLSCAHQCARLTSMLFMDLFSMWSAFLKSHVLVLVAGLALQTKASLSRVANCIYDRTLIPAVNFFLRSVKVVKSATWSQILEPTLTLLKMSCKAMLAIKSWLWNQVLKPTLQHLFNLIKNCLGKTVEALHWLHVAVIRPTLSNLYHLARVVTRWLWVRIIKPILVHSYHFGKGFYLLVHRPIQRLMSLAVPFALLFVAAAHAVHGIYAPPWEAAFFGLSSCTSAAAAVLFILNAFAGPNFRYIPIRTTVKVIRWYALFGDLGFGVVLGNILHFIVVSLILSAFATTLQLCEFVAGRVSQCARWLLTALDSTARFLGRSFEYAIDYIYKKVIVPARSYIWRYLVQPVWQSPVLTLAFCFAMLTILLRHHRDLVLTWNICRAFIVRLLVAVRSSIVDCLHSTSTQVASTRNHLVRQAGAKQPMLSSSMAVISLLSSELFTTCMNFSVWLVAPKVNSASALLASPHYARVLLVLHWLACSLARLILYESGDALFSRSGALQTPIEARNTGVTVAVVRLCIKLGLVPILLAGLAPGARLLRAFFLWFYFLGGLVRALQALDTSGRHERRPSSSSRLSHLSKQEHGVPLAVRLAAEFLATKTTAAEMDSEDCCPICLDALKVSSSIGTRTSAANNASLNIAVRWSQSGKPPPDNGDAQGCLSAITHNYNEIPCTLSCGHHLHFGCLLALATSGQRFSQRCPYCREPVVLPSTACQVASSLWF